MRKMETFLVACCQVNFAVFQDRGGIASRAEALERMTRDAVTGYEDYMPVKLVVFPEFALTPVIAGREGPILRDIAIPIENPYFKRLCRVAEDYDITICPGSFLERSGKYPGAVFNTSVLIDSEGIALVYRKLNPFLPFEPVHSPHDIAEYEEDIAPVSKTRLGNIGLEICYDSRFPELSRKLVLKGAEILIVPSAYMEPWGGVEPTDVWKTILRARAIENNVYVIGCSLGSTYENHPPYSWTGNSIVVDYEGRIVAQSPPGPCTQILVAPVNIGGLRDFRRQTSMLNMLHLRTELYRDLYEQTIFPPAGGVDGTEISQTSLRKAIARLKEKLL